MASLKDEAAFPKKATTLTTLTKQLSPIHAEVGRLTPEQRVGTYLASSILVVILGAIITLLVIWITTRPTLEYVKDNLNISIADTSKVQSLIEVTKTLQTEHTSQFRSIAELLVFTTLVPLFTLATGWIFGSKSKAE